MEPRLIIRRRAAHLVLIALAAAVVLISIPILRSDEYPLSADIMGHMTRAWYISESLRTEGRIPFWFPYWSNGIPTFQYYPFLSHLLLAGIDLLSQNIRLAYKIFLVGTLWAAGAGAYAVASRKWGPIAGVAAALLYLTAPFNLRTVFWAGSLPRTLMLALVPWLLLSLLHLLEHGKGRAMLATAFLTAGAILTHVMQAYMDVVGLALLSLPYAAHRTYRPRAALVAATVLLGSAMTAFWLLPSATHAELAKMPTVLAERVASYSIHLDAFDPTTRSQVIEFPYMGLALTIAGLAAGIYLLATKHEDRAFILGLLISGVVTGLLSFGTNLPLFHWFPLADNLLPRRFYNFTSLSWALLCGALIAHTVRAPLGYRRSVRQYALASIGLTLFLLVPLIDAAPYLSLARTSDYGPLRAAFAALPPGGPPTNGRLYAHTVRTLSEVSYFPVVQNRTHLAFFWCCTAGTPDELARAQINRMLRSGKDSLLFRYLELWSVRHAILDSDDPLVDAYIDRGFRRVADTGALVVLASDLPANYLQLHEPRWIVIGDGAPGAATVFPGLAIGHSSFIDDYSQEYLRNFTGVFLYGYRFHNREAAESLLLDLAREGIPIVIDMTTRYGSLLGVTGIPKDFDGVVTFQESGAPRALSIAAETLTIDFSEVTEHDVWRAPVYSGLITPILSTPDDKRSDIVLGQWSVGDLPIYFLGFNPIEFFLRTDDMAVYRLLQGIFLQEPALDRYEAVPLIANRVDWETDRIVVEYTLEQERALLVSTTYSPRWHASIDGREAPIYNHEDLILIPLAPGTHTLTLQYGTGGIQSMASALSAMSLALLVALAWRPSTILHRFRQTPDTDKVAMGSDPP